MQPRSLSALSVVLVLAVGTCRADFKYTQQSKVTGGALVGVSKTLGVFSKSARQVTAPQLSTTMVHGNRMRTENENTVEIIDLDGRRFIHVDTAKKSYFIQTFDQLKQQLEQARQKAKEEQTKAAAKHADAQNVTMVPKFDMQATGQTHTVLNVPAKEVKMRVDLLLKSTDPKTQADLEKSNATYWMTGDGWYGEIPGYDEVRQFHLKLAKELDWLPGSMGMSNPQMGQAAEEFKKNSIKTEGMPLVQFTSFGIAANGQAGQSGPSQGSTAQPDQQSSKDSSPTSTREALTKGLGGLFGKKKDKQEKQQTEASPGASSGVPQPAPVAGSMMDMTTEVTTYSRDPLDASLFDVPAGYAQVQPETPAH